MRNLIIGLVAVVAMGWPGNAAVAQTVHSEHHAASEKAAVLKTPSSISTEHRELHEVLERATKESGPLGAAARELEEALAPHFKREEEIATPPLGLLPLLAAGKMTPEMKAVLPLTRALERELPRMLREHGRIRAAAGKFRSAAEAAGRPDYVRFSDQLAAHARQEEEILYPAAVLVGRTIAGKRIR